MSCFPCFGRREKKEHSSSDGGTNDGGSLTKRAPDNTKDTNGESTTPQGSGNIQAQCYKFRELAAATDHFTPDFLLGEGDFARVYKGSLDSGNQTVAIKQLDRNGLQDSKEFLVQVLMLSLLHHPNLVNLIGYCADGDQRLLVYEFMPNGTLEDHLLNLTPDKQPMSWYTRMKIAYGAAQGLEYLHDKANPPVIYRDFKSSKILLDENLTPKLSDICLSKIGNMGDRVMGTYGYCAPEGDITGQLTLKSDVYSFGVVLLELITGRRAMDTTKPTNEQNLVAWAKPMFREQKRYPELVDLLIKDDFPSKGLNQVVAIAAMCLQEESSVRPLMADVVITLGFLVDAPPEPSPPPPTPDPTPQVDLPKTSDSSEHVVETLQLGVRGQGSKPPSRTTSRSSSSSGSESDGSVSSKHSKRSFRCESDATSSLKYSRKESEHRSDASDGSDDESDGSLSSKQSRGSSKHESVVYLSMKHSGESSKLGSRSSSLKHYQESPHGSGGEESDGSVSRHSEESEHEYESD